MKNFLSMYVFISSLSHGVQHYFPRLYGMGIPEAFFYYSNFNMHI